MGDKIRQDENTTSGFMGKVVDTIRYLHSAESTSRFQAYFGVERISSKIHTQCEEKRHVNHKIENGDCDLRSRKNVDNYEDNHEQSPIPPPLSTTPQDQYRINNRLAYFIFKFGSLLGQEEFYISFFPFWFWNFDGPTGRKMIVLWGLSMYVGQYLKEHLRWPRPASPPAVYLEKTFLSEFGMPSTHAIVAAVIPITVVYFERELCNLPLTGSCIFVAIYILLVCSSRLYVGVHTCVEVIVGLLISIVAIALYIPMADDLDQWIMSSLMGPAAVIWLCLGACLIFPSEGRRWTSAWADTISIMSVCAGILSGSWLGGRTGIWNWNGACLLQTPDALEIIRYVLRTALGLSIILCTRFIMKPAYRTFASTLHHVKAEDLKAKRLTRVEFPAQFLTYFAIAFNVSYTVPALLTWVGLRNE